MGIENCMTKRMDTQANHNKGNNKNEVPSSDSPDSDHNLNNVINANPNFSQSKSSPTTNQNPKNHIPSLTISQPESKLPLDQTAVNNKNDPSSIKNESTNIINSQNIKNDESINLQNSKNPTKKTSFHQFPSNLLSNTQKVPLSNQQISINYTSNIGGGLNKKCNFQIISSDINEVSYLEMAKTNNISEENKIRYIVDDKVVPWGSLGEQISQINKNYSNQNKSTKSISISAEVMGLTGLSKDYIKSYSNQTNLIGKPIIYDSKIEIFIYNIKEKNITMETIMFTDKLNFHGCRGDYASCNGKNNLYISGGEDQYLNILKDFWVVDLATLCVGPFKKGMPVPLAYHSMMFLPNKYIFFASGIDRKTFLFNVENSTFYFWANLNFVRKKNSLNYVNNRFLYVFSNEKRKISFEKTDLKGEKVWEVITPRITDYDVVFTQRFFSTIFDNQRQRIIFFGGEQDQKSKHENHNMLEYDIENNIIKKYNYPFDNVVTCDRTFVPLNSTEFFWFPDFQKENTEIMTYNMSFDKFTKLELGDCLNINKFIENPNIMLFSYGVTDWDYNRSTTNNSNLINNLNNMSYGSYGNYSSNINCANSITRNLNNGNSVNSAKYSYQLNSIKFNKSANSFSNNGSNINCNFVNNNSSIKSNEMLKNKLSKFPSLSKIENSDIPICESKKLAFNCHSNDNSRVLNNTKKLTSISDNTNKN